MTTRARQSVWCKPSTPKRLKLLTYCATMYQQSDDRAKRLANQAFFERVYIGEDEQPVVQLAEPFVALTPAETSHVGCSSKTTRVDLAGPKPNTQRRLERLSSAWDQAKRGIASEQPPVSEPEPGVVSNPTRRSRTPLTEREVDAIRTARANGESVVSIAKRFDIHRMTVWTHTKDSLA